MSSHVCPECGHLNGVHLIGCSRVGERGGCEFIVRPKPEVMDPFVPSDPEDPEVQAMVDAARGHYDESVQALAESAPDVFAPDGLDWSALPEAGPAQGADGEAEYGELAVVLPDEAAPMIESVILKPKRVHPDASTVHEVEIHFGIRPHSLARALKRFGMSKDLLGGGIAAAVERYLLECGCAARYRVDVTLSLQEGCPGVTLVKRGGN